MSKENQAIRYLLNNIYEVVQTQALNEGIAITLATTEVIAKNFDVDFLRSDEIQTVKNIFRGWKYVLEIVDEDITLEDIMKINACVSPPYNPYPGIIRTGKDSVYVKNKYGEKDYYPPTPDEFELRESIYQINQVENPLDQAIQLFLLLTKAQIFNDGNKRTASLIASKILLKHDIGILITPMSRINEKRIDGKDVINKIIDNDTLFKEYLMKYYLDEISYDEMKDIVLQLCIYGEEIDKHRDSDLRINDLSIYDNLLV